MAKRNQGSEKGPILITGGAGYIGSHMALALWQNGFLPIVVDDLSTGRREAVLHGELVVADVGDAERVAALVRRHGIHQVIHFAGAIEVEESMTDPLKYYHNNVAKSLTLIKTCLENGVSDFIFSSSAAVYGIPEKTPVGEEAPLAPINPYGSSKMLVEMILRDSHRAFPAFRYIALRYFNVAGADPQGRIGQKYPRPTHIITRALKTAIGQYPSLTIFGSDYPTRDGTAVRDYIHVDDLVAAHLAALEYLRSESASAVSRTFNCGYGRGSSVLEVVRAAQKVTGREFMVEMGPRRPGDPPELVADASRIRRELAWRPRHDNLEAIISSAWNWEKKLAGHSDR